MICGDVSGHGHAEARSDCWHNQVQDNQCDGEPKKPLTKCVARDRSAQFRTAYKALEVTLIHHSAFHTTASLPNQTTI